MLEEVLRYLKNWFEVERHCDTYEIKDEGITLPFLLPNQYYRIDGSLFNDGLHKYKDPLDVLVDETFEGSITAMAVPPAVVKIAAEINAWIDKNENSAVPLDSPFESESFAGYSYTRAKDQNGNSIRSWQQAFRTRLNPWRKI